MRKTSSFTTMVTSFLLLLLFALLLDSSSATARGDAGAGLLLKHNYTYCGPLYNYQVCKEPDPCCAKANGTCTDDICYQPDCDPLYGSCFPPPHSPPPPPHSPPPPPHSPPPPPHIPPPPPPHSPPLPPPHSPPPPQTECGRSQGGKHCDITDHEHPCCSREDLCGSQALYCDVDLGCQPEYGLCWTSPPHPPTLEPNNLIRGLFGEIQLLDLF